METIEYLDVAGRRDSRRVILDGERIAIGRSDANDIVLGDDPSVSRAHALLEHLPAGWAIRDLGSHNGTQVNGHRIWTESVLHPGDQVQIGSTRMVFGRSPSTAADRTAGPDRAPELTRREREVLIELCRPALSGEVFTEPASIRQMAATLFVTEAAVKQHLGHLYTKFRIDPDAERRRVLLANEAVRRRVVTLADLDDDDEPTKGHVIDLAAEEREDRTTRGEHPARPRSGRRS
jgi:pSer/pThr/pTyr-binding forkhead associated (FHA) protein